jgi:uncharacterized membrane protein
MSTTQVTRHWPVLIESAAAVTAAGIAFWTLLRVTTWGVYAPAVVWVGGGLFYLGGTWAALLPMNSERTKSHAEKRQRRTTLITDVMLVVACIASVGGVGHLLTAGSAQGAQKPVAAGIGVAAIVVAWCAVHTVFSLRYALLYYRTGPSCQLDDQTDLPRAIDFGREAATYLDFFYLGFTVGMAYAVSDTGLQTRPVRRTALIHAVLSYLFGAVILAVTINLVVSLSNSTG